MTLKADLEQGLFPVSTPLEHSQSDTQPLDDSVSVEPPSPRSHRSKVRKAIELGGGLSEGVDKLWIRFWTGEQFPPSTSPGYLVSAHQWRVLLNPSREHFYSAVSRSIFALKRAGLIVDGTVAGMDVSRKSRLKILDDPCEPKVMFCLTGSNSEEANRLLVLAVRSLEREFSVEEQTRIACPQGVRYRDDLRRSFPQWGPSFTRMRSPLLFYQQGGFVESERARIVQEEVERLNSGLQDQLQAYRRIRGRLSQFFEGEHFYRYVRSYDPFGASCASSGFATPPEGVSENLELQFEGSSLFMPLFLTEERKRSAEEQRGVSVLQGLWKEFSIDRSMLPRREFDELVQFRFKNYQECRSMRVQAQRGDLPFSIAGMCTEVFLRHPLLHELEILDSNPEGVFTGEQVPRLSLKWRRIRDLFGVQMGPQCEGEEELKQLREDCLKDLFSLSQEFQAVDLDPGLRGSSILWLTGSSTAALPLIFRPRFGGVPSLFPTGQLVQMGIPPLSGKLDSGILPNGLNMIALSGVGISHAATALQYACMAKPFSKEKELSFLFSAGTTAVEDMSRLKICALRLAVMGLSVEEKEAIGRSLRNVIADLPPTEVPKEGWERFLPLVGKLAPEQFLVKRPEFKPGMIVGVQGGDQNIVFGEVVPSFFGDVCVRNSPSGEPAWYNEWSLFPVSDELLQKFQLEQEKPLSQKECGEVGMGGEVGPWHFLIGKPFPQELVPERPSLRPGTILVVQEQGGEGRYAMVVAVREKIVEVIDDSGHVYGVSQSRIQWSRAPSDEFLERELRKEPILMDVEYAAQKVRLHMQGRKEAVEEILPIIETMSPTKWTDQERRFIEQPSPVVFGSLTKQPKVFQNGVSGERFLEGPQQMGKDIQLIFVPKDQMGEMREYVYTHMPVNPGVYILPLEVL